MFLLTRLNLWSSSTLFGAKKLLVSLFASSRTKCTITNVQQQKAPFPNYHPHSASISTYLPLTHCKSKTKCANGNGYRRWLSAMDTCIDLLLSRNDIIRDSFSWIVVGELINAFQLKFYSLLLFPSSWRDELNICYLQLPGRTTCNNNCQWITVEVSLSSNN